MHSLFSWTLNNDLNYNDNKQNAYEVREQGYLTKDVKKILAKKFVDSYILKKKSKYFL